MIAALKPGTLVIVAGTFGTVIGEARIGNAKGYTVATVPEHWSDGTFPRFAEAYMVHRAEIGKNVCAKPRGNCFCGFVHIDHPEWLATGGTRHDHA